MRIADKLRALCDECSLDWEVAKHLKVVTFVALLEMSRNKREEEKEKCDGSIN